MTIEEKFKNETIFRDKFLILSRYNELLRRIFSTNNEVIASVLLLKFRNAFNMVVSKTKKSIGADEFIENVISIVKESKEAKISPYREIIDEFLNMNHENERYINLIDYSSLDYETKEKIFDLFGEYYYDSCSKLVNYYGANPDYEFYLSYFDMLTDALESFLKSGNTFDYLIKYFDFEYIKCLKKVLSDNNYHDKSNKRRSLYFTKDIIEKVNLIDILGFAEDYPEDYYEEITISEEVIDELDELLDDKPREIICDDAAYFLDFSYDINHVMVRSKDNIKIKISKH